ncbi:MAG TPA: dTDP-4-amino-4,6-dideoxygalactose transaminase [Vicinamibacterales bacterium]|jgi:dTDP-4-amino-4,6-dideoxygalactose transaminase
MTTDTLPKIPFNRPYATGGEFAYVQQAIEAMHLSGDGPFTKRAHALLRTMTESRAALLTTSCTHALEMMALLLDLGPGDEVILPTFTFVSTANAFVLRGATPVFCDSRPDTLNLDESMLESLITPRTRAIVVVHYAGVGCEMDRILSIASAHGIVVLEDNAHGLLGRYRGCALGSFGAMASQSFHETKNFSCGEGGALVVTDPRYLERAEIIREKGTNRSQFFRGEIDKYTWVDVGSSYLPSEVLAAFLVAQLESAESIQERRRRIWNRYAAGLTDWARSIGAGVPCIPSHCEQPFHMFFVRLPSLEVRTALTMWLRARNIHAAFHYVPLHLSTMGHRFGGRPGQYPVAEQAGDCLLRLPFYTAMTCDEQDRVIEAVLAFKEH